VAKKIVLVTGGFDPVHSGHISYIRAARELGDVLIVGVNSDSWLVRKKGEPFMPLDERGAIIEEFKSVDVVIVFDDSDGTAIDAIKQVLDLYPEDEVLFANGGDRTLDNIPEMVVESERLHFVFGVGGEDKKNSSSWILKDYKERVTNDSRKEDR
jgi:D-beta-D-heptose 7-phosphate kinase/D-beta-D-heptose 1-phosphate adenosyltransferase